MTVEAATTTLRIGDHEIDVSQPTMRAEDVAAIWGISLWEVYEANTRDDLPVAPLRIGKRILRWPTAAVLATVALDGPEGGEPAPELSP
jgi:predicted DNA-binding transcriptional regulator AlpA